MDSDEDNFVKGAKKKQIKQGNIEINDLSKCVDAFVKYTTRNKQQGLAESIDLDLINNIIDQSNKGIVNEELIRPLLWKLSLNYFPYCNKNKTNSKSSTNTINSLNSWILSTYKQRLLYKQKVKEYLSTKNFSSDPLAQNNNPEWNSFFEDNNIKKQLLIDINRTYQEKDVFRNTHIRELLTQNLFIWTKENKSIGYWQGMNEIIALVFMSIHPYYHDSKVKINYNSNGFASTVNDEELLKNIVAKYKIINDSNTTPHTMNDVNWTNLYLFFNDSQELAADVFFLFNNLMKLGITDLYNKTPLKEIKDQGINSNIEEKKFNVLRLEAVLEKAVNNSKSITSITSISSITNNSIINSDILGGNTKIINSLDKKADFLKFRIDNIINNYLKIINEKLYNHFRNIELDIYIIMLRWFRCLFNREFHPSDCLKLCDVIISCELKEYLNTSVDRDCEDSDNSYFSSFFFGSYLRMIDYISLAMIEYLKEDFLTKDNTGCYMRLNKYPPIESINVLILKSLDIKAKVEKYFRNIKKNENSSKSGVVGNGLNSNSSNNTINANNISIKVNSNSFVTSKSKSNIEQNHINNTKSSDESLTKDDRNMKNEYFSNSDTNEANTIFISNAKSYNNSDSQFISELLTKYNNIFNQEEKERLNRIITKI